MQSGFRKYPALAENECLLKILKTMRKIGQTESPRFPQSRDAIRLFFQTLEEHRRGHIESLAQFINVIFINLALSI